MDSATELQSKGVQPTKQRLLLYNFFAHTPSPLSVTNLLHLLEEQNEKIHRATVFRTVRLLEVKKVLRKVDFYEGESRYELMSLPHHHHAVCRACGKIETIHECMASELIKKLRKKIGFEAVEHAFEVFGVCKKCRQLV